ncbi:Transcriptional regulatory protein OmpR [uncultured Alphaproteobacteria bacterium]|uniref:Regulatory protein VirG n=1 Tax=uncultured Alphaproteobacteria bacterium TaxID=91750 RepID=A0A212JI99_9PROT|nr:Transcriptional regulatory protein OmpR [uncultured Alphaproteobacteria bacterium]
MSAHILIVDDNAEMRELVGRALRREGHRVSAAADGRAMRDALAAAPVDLILLDLMLPGEDGLTLCRDLRATSAVPVIMLTAKGEELDRVLGLKMGADDYIPKPFSTLELLARVEAVLRRARGSAPPAEAPKRLRFAGWVLDLDRRELCSAEGLVVPLSTGEFNLLLALVERPRRVLSREQLLDLARGRSAVVFDRSIDTQVSRLRRKIEPDAKSPEIIKTVWGGGYMLAADVSPA